MKKTIVLVLMLCIFQLKAVEPEVVNPEVLIGQWKLDMTPENPNDDNFATMRVDSIEGNAMHGFFYRDGVKIRKGQVNIQSGSVYAALISGDNSGEYNSAFYYKEGVLYGTTHAVNRGFLSVWTAKKVND